MTTTAVATPSAPQTTIRPSAPHLGEHLRKLLLGNSETPGTTWLVEAIVNLTDPMRTELKAVFPALEAYCRLKAPAITVAAIMAEYTVVWPLAGADTKGDGELEAIAAHYASVLADCHPESLWRAMEQFAADPESQFFPKPGELRGRAKAQVVEGFLLHSRAKQLLPYA